MCEHTGNHFRSLPIDSQRYAFLVLLKLNNRNLKQVSLWSCKSVMLLSYFSTSDYSPEVLILVIITKYKR